MTQYKVDLSAFSDSSQTDEEEKVPVKYVSLNIKETSGKSWNTLCNNKKRPRRGRYFLSICQPFCLGLDLEAWGQKCYSQTDRVTDRQPS